MNHQSASAATLLDPAMLITAVAERLHRADPDPGHAPDDGTGACSHCWSRARTAMAVLQEPDPGMPGEATQASDTAGRWGWAMWDSTGAIEALMMPDPPIDDGWTAVTQTLGEQAAVHARGNGYSVEQISGAELRMIQQHYGGFSNPGSRGALLAERRQIWLREASGIPHPYGYAAWDGAGELVALGEAVLGMNGWHSLGISKPADHMALDDLTVEEYRRLSDFHSYDHRRPGGRSIFLAWRNPGGRQSHSGLDQSGSFSTAHVGARRDCPAPDCGEDEPELLAQAFATVVTEYGGEVELAGTPAIVVGHYLLECLTAYSRALIHRSTVTA